MEKEISNPNPVQILALHIADMSGKDFCDKRNEREISTLYVDARRYLKRKKKNYDFLSWMIYTDSYDCRHISRYPEFGAILSANILKLLK
jgi:hypothetical protein